MRKGRQVIKERMKTVNGTEELTLIKYIFTNLIY